MRQSTEITSSATGREPLSMPTRFSLTKNIGRILGPSSPKSQGVCGRVSEVGGETCVKAIGREWTIESEKGYQRQGQGRAAVILGGRRKLGGGGRSPRQSTPYT